MESLIKRFLYILAFGITAFNLEAAPAGFKKRLLHVAYYKNIFGHIHKNPSRYSQSLSTIECGHPVKIYVLVNLQNKSKQELFEGRFHYVKVGPYEGYIDKSYLTLKRGDCFQDRFPRFFDHLELELTDMYYWGKLYDQYVYGKSRVQ